MYRVCDVHQNVWQTQKGYQQSEGNLYTSTVIECHHGGVDTDLDLYTSTVRLCVTVIEGHHGGVDTDLDLYTSSVRLCVTVIIIIEGHH